MRAEHRDQPESSEWMLAEAVIVELERLSDEGADRPDGRTQSAPTLYQRLQLLQLYRLPDLFIDMWGDGIWRDIDLSIEMNDPQYWGGIPFIFIFYDLNSQFYYVVRTDDPTPSNPFVFSVDHDGSDIDDLGSPDRFPDADDSFTRLSDMLAGMDRKARAELNTTYFDLIEEEAELDDCVEMLDEVGQLAMNRCDEMAYELFRADMHIKQGEMDAAQTCYAAFLAKRVYPLREFENDTFEQTQGILDPSTRIDMLEQRLDAVIASEKESYKIKQLYDELISLYQTLNRETQAIERLEQRALTYNMLTIRDGAFAALTNVFVTQILQRGDVSRAIKLVERNLVRMQQQQADFLRTSYAASADATHAPLEMVNGTVMTQLGDHMFNRMPLGRLYIVLGECYLQADQPEAAQAAFEMAMHCLEPVPSSQVKACVRLIDIYTNQKQDRLVDKMSNRAIKLYRIMSLENPGQRTSISTLYNRSINQIFEKNIDYYLNTQKVSLAKRRLREWIALRRMMGDQKGAEMLEQRLAAT